MRIAFACRQHSRDGVGTVLAKDDHLPKWILISEDFLSQFVIKNHGEGFRERGCRITKLEGKIQHLQKGAVDEDRMLALQLLIPVLDGYASLIPDPGGGLDIAQPSLDRRD